MNKDEFNALAFKAKNGDIDSANYLDKYFSERRQEIINLVKAAKLLKDARDTSDKWIAEDAVEQALAAFEDKS